MNPHAYQIVSLLGIGLAGTGAGMVWGLGAGLLVGGGLLVGVAIVTAFLVGIR